jgi:hypothetical protein
MQNPSPRLVLSVLARCQSCYWTVYKFCAGQYRIDWKKLFDNQLFYCIDERTKLNLVVVWQREVVAHELQTREVSLVANLVSLALELPLLAKRSHNWNPADDEERSHKLEIPVGMKQ